MPFELEFLSMKSESQPAVFLSGRFANTEDYLLKTMAHSVREK